MLTHYKGQFKLKDCGLRDRQAVNDGQSASRSGSRLAIIMHAMLQDGTEFVST